MNYLSWWLLSRFFLLVAFTFYGRSLVYTNEKDVAIIFTMVCLIPGVGETAGAIVLLAALLRIIYSILGWMIKY